MKITVEFELPDSYAACFCNDKDRIDSLIGSVDKDFTYSIISSELLEKRDELLEARKNANQFIIDIAELLGMDTDGIGFDGLQFSIDDFDEAINKATK